MDEQINAAAEKRRRADIVVPSGLGRALTFRRLKRIVRELSARARTAAPEDDPTGSPSPKAQHAVQALLNLRID